MASAIRRPFNCVYASDWAPPSKGWQAAEHVLEPETAGVTAAGLPRRTRGANLVPGTAAAASVAGTVPPPSARSAAATRDRFAKYQRGIRHGRAVVGGEAPDGEGGGEDGASDEA